MKAFIHARFFMTKFRRNVRPSRTAPARMSPVVFGITLVAGVHVMVPLDPVSRETTVANSTCLKLLSPCSQLESDPVLGQQAVLLAELVQIAMRWPICNSASVSPGSVVVTVALLVGGDPVIAIRVRTCGSEPPKMTFSVPHSRKLFVMVTGP